MATDSPIRFEVPSQDVLRQLVAAPLPLGLRSGRPTRSFHRDIYLDTPDGELQRAGVACRFRIRTDDRRSLRVTMRSAVAGGALVEYDQFESEVPEVEPLAALQGGSEPARRLRAVVDPARLGVRVELQVERVLRVVRPRWLPLKTLEIAYDVVSVHSGGLSRTFCEMRLRRVGPGGPTTEEVADALQRELGVRPMPARRVDRAEELLSAMETEPSAATATRIPEVAVITVADGVVALRDVEGTLRLPVREGRGEEAAQRLVREATGIDGAALELLGTVAASPSSAAMEVWLARCGAADANAGPGATTRWVRLIDVVTLAGAPAIRDGRTLAAVALLARADSFAELCRPNGGTASAPPALSRADLRGAPAEGELAEPQQFLNVELSLLEFNGRLLDLAEDESIPLLARLRFLAIFSANTDEFFAVRVGGLKRALVAGETARGEDGLGVHEQLDAIAVRLRYLLERQRYCLERTLLPALSEHDIRITGWATLDDDSQRYLTRYYNDQVFALLTPHAVTRAPGHPFPQIEDLRLSVAAMVRDEQTGRLRFGVTTLPGALPRFVPLPDGKRFVPLEDVVHANIERLYPGRRVEAAHLFRITRIGDLELDEEHADDLLEAVEEEVRRRPFAGVVRLEVARDMPPVMRDLLLRELQMVGGGRGTTPGASGIYDVDGLMDPSSLLELAALDRHDLDYVPFAAASPISGERPIFDALREREMLVHHPYDAFETTTQRLFTEAADDPAVLAIKVALYRAGRQSPIVDALIDAVKSGKKVDALVELKARFDWETNTGWVRKLERAGVHVVYGLVNLKTHSKLAMVVRRENGAVRRYVHVGTGNYNASTARLYTDLGLLSSDDDLGADVNDLFNQLIGSSRPSQSGFRRLLVAPGNMLQRFLALIDREAENAARGAPAGIRIKVNGLGDAEVVRALYRAAQAGVPIDLVVRGICTLRPGVPGVSEGIRVVSVMGRFLEHGRIYHFRNGGDDAYYIGSADWRPRNLRRRVEVVTSVLEPRARARLDQILTTELEDPTAWELQSDGSYVRRVKRMDGVPRRSAQEVFLQWLAAP